MLRKLSNTINQKKFIKKVITLDEVNKVLDNQDSVNKEKYLDFNTLLKIDLLEEVKFQNNKIKEKLTRLYNLYFRNLEEIQKG
jgi:long-chain acyl-CoA synthetase